MAKRKKTFIDRNGDTVRGVPSYLFIEGFIPYEVVPGTPSRPMDLEYDPDDPEDGNDEVRETGLYMRWSGRVLWGVHVVHEDSRWHVLHTDSSAASCFKWMKDFGQANRIRTEEALHIPSSILESDMMRENAMDSMGPKFFVGGNILDRRGEKYVKEEDDGIVF